MERMRHSLIVSCLPLLALLCPGCDTESPSIIQILNPVNGATAVSTTTTPLIRFYSKVGLDAGSRNIVLYNITGGAKKTVAGDLLIEGVVLTYKPKTNLGAKKDYMMEVQKAAIVGDDFELSDSSEPVIEIFSWPYSYRFSTRSAPRVRAAYLQMVEQRPRVTVHFSQKMAPVATGAAVKLLDGVTHKEISLGAPAWQDDATVIVEPAVTEKLTSGQLYTLKVAVSARSADNTALDGDMDGNPGESKDDFCVGFTTLQQVIFSRLGGKKPSVCP